MFHAIIRGNKPALRTVLHNQYNLVHGEKDKGEDNDKVERFFVKKNGVTKTVILKKHKVEALGKKIEAMTRRDRCIDLFKDIEEQVTGELSPAKLTGKVPTSYPDFLRYKAERTSKMAMHDRIRLLMDSRLIGGVVFLKTLLKRIELAKELFMLDLEKGDEVLIPPELSQDNLPASFKYYDCILAVVQQRVSPKKKEDYNLRKQAALRHHDNAPLAHLERLLGLRPENEKMKVQYKTINEKQRKEIDFKKSTHVREIQRSRYLQIDDNLLDERQLRNETNLEGFKVDDVRTGVSATGLPERYYSKAAEETSLNVKYLKTEDVQNRR